VNWQGVLLKKIIPTQPLIPQCYSMLLRNVKKKGCSLSLDRFIKKTGPTTEDVITSLPSTSYDVSADDSDHAFSLESSSFHQQKTNYFRPKIRI